MADAARNWPGSPILVQRPEDKYDAFAASRAALAASGTVALELAMARVPMVVGYRLNPLTEKLLDRVLKVRQVNLVNLLLGETLVTELLGPNCAPEHAAAAARRAVSDERVRSRHRQGYDQAMRRLDARRHGAEPARRRPGSRDRCRPPPPTEEFTMTTADTDKFRYLHTMIRVRDLDASLKFYTEQLGMKLLRKRDYPTGKFTLAFVGYGDETDHTVLELTHNWEQAEPYNLGSAFGHLALGVPDVYKACEQLAAAGVKIPRPAGPMAHGGSVIAFIEDPDGYRIELVQRP